MGVACLRPASLNVLADIVSFVEWNRSLLGQDSWCFSLCLDHGGGLLGLLEVYHVVVGALQIDACNLLGIELLRVRLKNTVEI